MFHTAQASGACHLSLADGGMVLVSTRNSGDRPHPRVFPPKLFSDTQQVHLPKCDRVSVGIFVSSVGIIASQGASAIVFPNHVWPFQR